MKTAKKLRDKDYIGRDVVLLTDLRTQGGALFRKGTRMRVYGAWRGRFHLDALTPTGRLRMSRGWSVGIRQVGRYKFTLVGGSDRSAA